MGARFSLPSDLERERTRIEALALEHGLSFFPVEFELVDWETLAMIAAYNGFPRRYPHWRHGMAYEELSKSYRFGLAKIYELVINTDPVIAYLLETNSPLDHKLVMAHVYGHADFFKNNAFFAQTNRKMLDGAANHASAIKRYIDRYGLEAVESFLDIALSLENLIDPHTLNVRRIPTSVSASATEPPEPHLERYLHELEQQDLEQQDEGNPTPIQPPSIPLQPERDVLAFLMSHAPLRDWQRDILGIVREEAYYFAPQAMTKVMNEGWASFWHSHLITHHLAEASEIVDYADVNAGVMGGGAGLNPYKLGLLLWREIESRWDRGQHGLEWERCDDLEQKRNWDSGERGRGLERIFEVRHSHNDVTFLDEFLTEDFCYRHRLFVYELKGSEDQFKVASREFAAIKSQLLAQFTNAGQPIIRVLDSNLNNRGELLLGHEFAGTELDITKAELTLENLFRLWTRPVHVLTVLGNEAHLLSFDGISHTTTKGS